MQGYNPNWSGLLNANAQKNQALGGLGQAIGQTVSQNRQQQELKDNQSQMQNDINTALKSGNPAEIAQMSIKYPEMSGQIKQAFGFTNEATERNFKDTNFKILSDPSNASSFLQERVDYLDSIGADSSQPKARLQMLASDPDKFLKVTEGLTSAMYAPEYESWKSSTIDPNATKPMTEYQKESLNLQKETLKANQEYKKAVAEEKKAQGSIKQEEATIKREAAEAKTNELKQVDQQNISDGIYTATQNKQAISDLLNNDGYMGSLTGYTGRAPTITTEGVEAEAYLDNIKNSMTIDNLSAMSGPLTDKDIQIIASASSRLRAGMSEKALSKELKTIDNAYNRVIKNYEKEAKRKGYSLQSEDSNLSDEDLLSKYL